MSDVHLNLRNSILYIQREEQLDLSSINFCMLSIEDIGLVFHKSLGVYRCICVLCTTGRRKLLKIEHKIRKQERFTFSL